MLVVWVVKVSAWKRVLVSRTVSFLEVNKVGEATKRTMAGNRENFWVFPKGRNFT